MELILIGRTAKGHGRLVAGLRVANFHHQAANRFTKSTRSKK
jgi:hypothetical protein